MSSTRTQWVARCACRPGCDVELAYDDEASARRMVDHYGIQQGRAYHLVRRDIAITETVIYPPEVAA